MKKKEEYFPPGGKFDRRSFRQDLIREVRGTNVSIPQALVNFFNTGNFTKNEMGRFALETSSHGELVEGAVVLIHALSVTAKTAQNVRILEDYIGVSETDPSMWGASWVIDSVMNWPLGTSLPASRPQLDRV